MKHYNNAALGFFDGVHLGHKYLLGKLPKNEKNLIISFKKNSATILDIKTKEKELKRYGDVKIYSLENGIENESKEFFIDKLKTFGIKNIYVGEDYKFGYKAQGDILDLKLFFNVIIIPFQRINNLKISSTSIKEDLKNGNILAANEKLGYNYYIKDLVVQGNGIGNKKLVPTINFYPQSSILKNGVYKTKSIIKNKEYLSITNIGYKPTLGKNNLSVETNILENFNDDIYDVEVKVEFIKFIRGEIKFNSLDELKIQINKDIKKVEESYEN